MARRSPMTHASLDPVPLPDETDELEAFAAQETAIPPYEARPPLDDAGPELIWLAETTDGLEAFAPEADRTRPTIEATARHPDSGSVTKLAPAAQAFIPAWTGREFSGGLPSRFDWMKRASRAALLFVGVATAADWFLDSQLPATLPSSVERSEPATVPSSVSPDVVSAASNETLRVEGPVPLVVTRAPSSVRRDEPATSARGADAGAGPRVTVPSASYAGAGPTPGPPSRTAPAIDAPARSAVPTDGTTAVDGSSALSTPSAAVPIPAPAVTTSDAASPPAVRVPPAGDGPNAPAPAPAETSRTASADVTSTPSAGRPSRELDARAIENVLGRYRSAFNSLDASAASAVWPSVNEKTLARAFERLENQDLSFERCQIETAAGHAEAACSGTARYVPKVGSRTPNAEARQWTFSLSKADGGWLIDRVDAR